MLNICVCDDDCTQLDTMSTIITKISISENIETKTHLFADGQKLFDFVKSNSRLSLIIFMDIEFGNDNGIDLLKTIQTNLKLSSSIYFVSSYPQYVFDSFQVHPLDFILKPITCVKLTSILKAEQSRLSSGTREIISVFNRSLHQNVLIPLQDIVYFHLVSSPKRLISVRTVDSLIDSSGRLNDWESKITDENFLRIHRSILVNMAHVQSFGKSELLTDQSDTLPIGRTQRGKVKAAFIAMIEGSLK